MKKLKCMSMSCQKEKPIGDFTKFSRNNALADRNYRVIICKDCCSKMVLDGGNTKEALREVLRLIDVPYYENFANKALENYATKLKSTNVIIKKNIYSDEEKVHGYEKSNLQNTIYTCYTALIGLMPKNGLNFSYSDGVYVENTQPQQTENKEELYDESDKETVKAENFLIRHFSKDIVKNEQLLKKAVKIKLDELGLQKNNSSNRQLKYRIKMAISTLVDAERLARANFDYLLDEPNTDVNKDMMAVDYEKKEFDIEQVSPKLREIPIEELKSKWGEDFTTKDLYRFEKKHEEMSRLYSSANEEFLKHACIASVKASECMAKNDSEGTKLWMGIFKDVTTGGKLAPNTLKDSEVNGGITSISELTKMLEQEVGVISILPEFKKKPKDDADFVIFCLVQYVRRLKGYPDCKYEDIWKFYDELAESFMENEDEYDSIIEEMINDEDDEDVNSQENGDDVHDNE